MGNWGTADWALPLSSLATGGVDLAISEAWTRRTEIRKHLERQRPQFQACHENWWDAVAGIFLGGDVEKAIGLTDVVPIESDMEWSKKAKEQRVLFRTLSGGIAGLWTEWDDIRSQRDLLLHERNVAIKEKDNVLSSRSFRLASFLRRGVVGLRRAFGERQ
jgi:hypothetical protein